jgi:thiol-disulfide isomerase/thioredoxin
LEPPLLSSRPLTLVVLGLAVLAAGCDRQSGQTAQPQASPTEVPKGTIDRSHKGSALPDFVLADPTGKELRLAVLKGEPLLVNLWATWCAPCIRELPLLEKLGKSGDVRVLAVSQDTAEPARVAAFLKDRNLSLEPWLDPKNDLSFHYATGTLPTTVYYDAHGREVWRYVGERDWTDAETRAMLGEAGER